MNTATAQRVDISSLVEAPAPFHAPAVRVNTGVSLTDDRAMEAMYRFATTMASGRATVPQHLQGNVGDCMAVSLQAQRWGMSPFVVAQKTHLVNGQLGYEAQLVAAVVNTSTALTGRLKYAWFGPWEKIVGKFKQLESKTKKDDNGYPKKYMVPDWRAEDEQGLGVRVWGTMRGEDEPRELEILMTQARTRNSTLWAEDPKQQIAYLATKRWSRLYLPEVLLGVYDPDEFATSTQYMGAADVVGDTRETASEELTKTAFDMADKGRDAFVGWWQKQGKPTRDLLRGSIDELGQRAADADKKRTVDNPAEAPAQAPAAAPAAEAKPGRARPPAPAPKPAAPAAAPAAATNTGAPTFTAENVHKRLTDAKDLDALYIAADLIDHVPEEARAELNALFDTRQDALNG